MMAVNKDKNSLEEKNKEYTTNLIISLDLDFLYYLKQLEICRKQMCLESEKELVQEWCDKLLGEKRMSIANKRRRNVFLAQLILAIKENRLSFSPVFSKPAQPLSSYTNTMSVFGFTSAPHNNATSTTEKRNVTDLSDYAEFSENKQTYLATKALRDGSGFMAYVGLASGETPKWLDDHGKPFNEAEESNCSQECSSQNQNAVKSRTYKQFVSCKTQGQEFSGKMAEDRRTVNAELLKKIEKSMKQIEATQCIPLNEDDNVLCIMDRLQKKLACKRNNKLLKLPATQRYYEMLKLIRKTILRKQEVESSPNKCIKAF